MTPNYMKKMGDYMAQKGDLLRNIAYAHREEARELRLQSAEPHIPNHLADMAFETALEAAEAFRQSYCYANTEDPSHT